MLKPDVCQMMEYQSLDDFLKIKQLTVFIVTAWQWILSISRNKSRSEATPDMPADDSGIGRRGTPGAGATM